MNSRLVKHNLRPGIQRRWSRYEREEQADQSDDECADLDAEYVSSSYETGDVSWVRRTNSVIVPLIVVNTVIIIYECILG